MDDPATEMVITWVYLGSMSEPHCKALPIGRERSCETVFNLAVLRPVMKSNEGLKVGDLVQLKSGGPVMTVYEIHPENQIATMWCSLGTPERFCRELFPAAVLRPVSDVKGDGT